MAPQLDELCFEVSFLTALASVSLAHVWGTST
jgi:hypothetical protein